MPSTANASGARDRFTWTEFTRHSLGKRSPAASYRRRRVDAERGPGPASHGYDADRTKQYVDALAARVRALPGVADVAVADRAPFFIGTDRRTAVSATGAACETDACPTYATMAIGSGYFKTMGIALAHGRDFGAGPAAAEVVIDQPLARSLGLEGHALGETLRVSDERTAVTVIGVTATTHTRGLDREQPTLYVPLDRTGFEGHLTLVARTATAPERLVLAIAQAAQEVDPRISMLSVKTMHQRMAVQLWPSRTLSWLFAVCGTLALILGVVGLAGVVVTP